jgi:hypothetical protein
LFTDPDLPATPGAQAAAAAREVEIPAGLILQLEMPALDLKKAAVGDALEARLAADVKKNRELLAPKGAMARGRIVRLDRSSGYFVLKIDFQDLEWPGGHARLKLIFDDAAVVARQITRGQPGGEILIPRQAGPRLSAILMFWRSEH